MCVCVCMCVNLKTLMVFGKIPKEQMAEGFLRLDWLQFFSMLLQKVECLIYREVEAIEQLFAEETVKNAHI